VVYKGFIIFIILGVIAVIGLVTFVFPMLLGLSIGTKGNSHAPSSISEVSLPQNATLPDFPKNFEPSTAKVVIGFNNKVRWTNYDIVKISVLADDKSDPGFFNATHSGASNEPAYESLLNSYESFEYTFTKTGEYGYHCSIHPWMQGSVIVLQQVE